jgi:hypothetical protein
LKTYARRLALAVAFVALGFAATAPMAKAQCKPGDCLTTATPATTALTAPVINAQPATANVQALYATEQYVVDARAARRDWR